MKLPRDTNARELIKALQRIGYQVVRQSGSHIRLQTDQPKPHAVTIPSHAAVALFWKDYGLDYRKQRMALQRNCCRRSNKYIGLAHL